MKRTVLWDSSAILALIDADDRDHATAKRVAKRLASERRPCAVTNYVEVETHALLLRKLGRGLAHQWLLSAPLPVFRTSPSEEERAREILAHYTDKDFSLCDAISFAVVESRAIGATFSFDRHFEQWGKVPVLGLAEP